MPLRIGLTGGIGSSKSTAARIFEAMGAPVIDADEIVRDLSRPGQAGYKQIVAHFGNDALATDGTLDRDWLRDRVFSEPGMRRKLEGILHPPVRSAMELWASRQTAPYCVLVVPLLIETGFKDMMDRICVVMAAEDIRRERVRNRGLSDEQIKAIMDSQASDAQRLAAADDIIRNDGSHEDLKRQVEDLDSMYRVLATDSP